LLLALTRKGAGLAKYDTAGAPTWELGTGRAVTSKAFAIRSAAWLARSIAPS
jgi:hypothetical protein